MHRSFSAIRRCTVVLFFFMAFAAANVVPGHVTAM
jgi:hypothetical protein